MCTTRKPLFKRAGYAILALSVFIGLSLGCRKLTDTTSLKDSTASSDAAAFTALPVPACIAFVEVNNNDFDNMGCFLRSSGKPIVSVASIFAANINYLNGNRTLSHPVVSLNPQVDYLLTQTTYVHDLHAKGINVTLSLLNNHDHSGWSEFYTQAEADSFAKSVQTAVNRFGVDGIEIDDEYSDTTGTTASIPMVVKAIRALLPNIVIGYYLYSDSGVNPATILAYKYADKTKFASLLTYAIGNFGDELSEYTSSISKTKLFYESTSSTVGSNAVSAKTNGYGGVMLFSANGSSLSAFQSVAQAFYGDTASVSTPSGCLQPDEGQQSAGAPALTYIY